jgi:hypothetical protein
MPLPAYGRTSFPWHFVVVVVVVVVVDLPHPLRPGGEEASPESVVSALCGTNYSHEGGTYLPRATSGRLDERNHLIGGMLIGHPALWPPSSLWLISYCATW